MQGYDEKNILLLPPRGPGESLPEELREYYTDYCSQMNDKGNLNEYSPIYGNMGTSTATLLHLIGSNKVIKCYIPAFSKAKGRRG